MTCNSSCSIWTCGAFGPLDQPKGQKSHATEPYLGLLRRRKKCSSEKLFGLAYDERRQRRKLIERVLSESSRVTLMQTMTSAARRRGALSCHRKWTRRTERFSARPPSPKPLPNFSRCIRSRAVRVVLDERFVGTRNDRMLVFKCTRSWHGTLSEKAKLWS